MLLRLTLTPVRLTLIPVSLREEELGITDCMLMRMVLMRVELSLGTE